MRPARTMLLAGASKKAGNPTSVVATDAGADDISVTWTNPPDNQYDGLQLWRKIDAGAFTQIATPVKGTTSYTDSDVGNSIDVQYRVVATKTGGTNSDNADGNTLRKLPAVPAIINWYVAAINGQMQLDATSPGHSKITGFDVAISTDNGSNWGSTVDTGADPDHLFTGVGHYLNTKARVRTRDSLGQVSAWVVSGTTVSVNDTAGPTAPTPTVSGWDDVNKGWNLSWTAHSDALSTITGTTLQVRINGGGWSNVGVFTAGAAQSNIFYGVADADRGKTFEFRLVTVDQWGNSTNGSASTLVTAKPLGTFYIGATATKTWSITNSQWRSDDASIRSGNPGSGYFLQNGYWFYGTQIVDVCKGYSPDAMSLLFIRHGLDGVSGVNKFSRHAHASQPGGAPSNAGDNANGPTLSGISDESQYQLINAAWLASLANGTYKGFCTTDSGGYRYLHGIDSNGYSGLLTLVFY